MTSSNLELLEETGIKSSEINIDPNFRFEHVIIDLILIVFIILTFDCHVLQVYYPVYECFGNRTVKKTLVMFLAKLKEDAVTVNSDQYSNSFIQSIFS